MIGNYGNGNTGDDAILLQVAPSALERGRVTVLSRNPERIARLVPEIHSVAMVSVRAFGEFLRADTVVIGGGGMFGRGIPPLVACLPFVLLVAELMGKDVELCSVGAYPDMPAAVAWALRRVARKARRVTARDMASVAALGGPAHATLVRDPAWELQPAAADAVRAALSAAGVRADRPMIAVSLKPGAGTNSDHLCLSGMAEGLDRWAQGKDCEILYLSFSDKGDYHLGASLTDLDLGRSLQEKMVNGHCVRFIGPDLHPAVMLGIVQCCRGVVAMRLHAQIFAMAVDRPVYGLSFEAKCDQFLDSMGVPPVRPDAVSGDDLGRWLEDVAPQPLSH